MDLSYVIDSADKKEEAFRIHCMLNDHRLLNAFYTYPGKYLRVYASLYQFQKVVMELRGEQLSLPDSLALHAARFHITGPEQGNCVFTWKVTAPSSTNEVSLQVPLQGNARDVPEIKEVLINASTSSPDEVIDAPRWASKPINHISENPRQHFLNSYSGSDRVGQGRLCDIRGQDENHQAKNFQNNLA